MLNHHINSSDNSGTDHLQAAAIEWQRNLHKELEADNLAAERPTARSDNNYMAKLVVAQALRLNAEQSAMVNEQAEVSCDTLALEVDASPSPSTETQTPGIVQDDVPHADHELLEPCLPEPKAMLIKVHRCRFSNVIRR